MNLHCTGFSPSPRRSSLGLLLLAVMGGMLSAIGQSALPSRPAASGRPVHRLPLARVGEFYEYVVVVQGLVEPLQYSWSGTPPDGLELAGPRCWGTPREANPGPIDLSVTITDALGDSLERHFQIAVRPALSPLRLATRSLPEFVRGQPVEFEFAASGGEGNYRWEAEAPELPDGLRLEFGLDRSRCLLRGTPGGEGPIRLILGVADGLTNVGPAQLTGRVGSAIAPRLGIATTSLPPAFLQIPYAQSLSATGGVPPYAWTFAPDASAPPDWLSLQTSQGTLHGQPPRLGSHRLSVVVTDSLGNRASRAPLDLAIRARTDAQLAILPATLPPAVSGHPYAATLVAAGHQGDVRWQVDGLPPWLSATPDGALLTLAGTPTGTNTCNLSVSSADWDAAPASTTPPPTRISAAPPRTYALAVVEPKPDPEPPRILTRKLPIALAGHPFHADIAASGGTGPVRFSGTISNASWLELRPDGHLQGTPASAGSALLQLVATDDSGRTSAIAALRLSTLAAGTNRLNLAIPAEIVAEQGRPFTLSLAIGGGTSPYQLDLAGELPPGITFDPAAARLEGVPGNPGEFALRARLQDSAPTPDSLEKGVTLRVLPAAIPGVRRVHPGWLAAAALAGGGVAWLLALPRRRRTRPGTG